MKKSLTFLASIVILATASPATAMNKKEPRFTRVIVDQLEARDSDDGTVMAWEASAWHGGDINKLFFSTEGERLMVPEHDDEDPSTESAETRLAWNHAFAPFWDGQLGVRRDWQPNDPSRDWVSVGVQGIAPYWFEVDANLFVGEDGLTNLRIEAEYELMLTQKLVLAPNLETNLYGKDDDKRGIGNGLTDIEAGLRLRYEIRREIAPYIGVHWEKLYGDTADIAQANGEKTEQGIIVAGLRIWF